MVSLAGPIRAAIYLLLVLYMSVPYTCFGTVGYHGNGIWTTVSSLWVFLTHVLVLLVTMVTGYEQLLVVYDPNKKYGSLIA